MSAPESPGSIKDVNVDKTMDSRRFLDSAHATFFPPPGPSAGIGLMSRANKTQQGGDHYMKKAIQPWDYIVANDIGFLEGSAIKYLTRHKQKDGIEDIQKALHFVQKLLEVEKAKVGK